VARADPLALVVAVRVALRGPVALARGAPAVTLAPAAAGLAAKLERAGAQLRLPQLQTFNQRA
jgi:hypothetical protein